jgi:hypothetical protein
MLRCVGVTRPKGRLERNEIKHKFNKDSHTAGKDWLVNFLKRNPSVSIRKPEATSINRIVGFSKTEVT